MPRVIWIVVGLLIAAEPAFAQGEEEPPACKKGASVKITGVVDEVADGLIELLTGAKGACSVQSIDPKGNVPAECTKDAKITASGKIRIDTSTDEFGTNAYPVLEDLKELKCETLATLAPEGCKVGADHAVTGVVDHVAPRPTKPNEWGIHLKSHKSKDGCSFESLYTAQPVPASCAKGSTISGKGRVHGQFAEDGQLALWIEGLQGFECSGAAAKAAAAGAEKDCEDPFAANDRKYAACTELISKDPNNAAAYRNRAIATGGNCVVNKTASDCEKAAADLSKVLELKPGDPDVHELRGTKYASLKKYDLAIADYTKAIELKPTNPMAFSLRASAHKAKEDYPAAVADYTKLIEWQPGFIQHYADRGWSHMQSGDYKAAAEDYARVVAVRPWDMLSGDILKGLKSLPTGADAATECAADLGRARTLKACNEVIAKDPKAAKAYYHRAKAYDVDKSKEEQQKALDDFRKAMELDPSQPDFYIGRGYVLANMFGYVEVAIQDFGKAIALDPKRAEPHYALSRIYAANKNLQRQTEEISKAVELDPQNANYLCYRSGAYFKAGDKARADADNKAADKVAGKEDYCEAD